VHPTRLLVLLAALAAPLLPVTAAAQGARIVPPNGKLAALSAESALVVDPDGKILFAKNADDERAPARPARRPATERSWHGLPPITASMGPSAAICSSVISVTLPRFGTLGRR